MIRVDVSSGVPHTLAQAHDLLIRTRPSWFASDMAWLRYYRESAAVYEQVAEADPGHQHEARQWARWEQTKADELAATMTDRAADALRGNENVHREHH